MVQHLPVAVGVDGSAASSAAIHFAALEAFRLDTRLLLVHVIPDYIPITPMMPLVPLDLEDTGREILAGAETEAHRVLPMDQVETLLLNGNRGAALVQASQDAQLLALGAAHRALAERILTGSTLHRVAGRTRCPLVAVPASWRPSQVHHRIVAGIKSIDHCDELLQRVFETASERRASVVLVHGWELDGEYDDLITARVDEDAWADCATDLIEARLSDLREKFPDVAVDIRVHHGQPAQVLQTASERADLLLIGGRRHGAPFAHLGPTGFAVLRLGHCPIEVVPMATKDV